MVLWVEGDKGPSPRNDGQTEQVRPVVWHYLSPVLLKEGPLQELIEERPGVLPWVDKGPAAVAIELRVPKAGQADVVVVDAAGQITIVECKLAWNGDYRQVVGQVLSYAAGLWGLDDKQFEDRFDHKAKRTTGLVAPLPADDDWDETRFRRAIGEHLEAGAFRLIIAVDVVTKQLEQTVEFLAAQIGDHVRLAVLVCGDNAEGQSHIPRGARSPEALVAAIRARDPRAGDGAEALLHWAALNQLEVRCNGKDGVVKTPEDETLFRIVGHREMVRVSRHAPHADEQLVEQLDAIGFETNPRRAKTSLAVLYEDGKLSEFTALMDRVLVDLSP